MTLQGKTSINPGPVFSAGLARSIADAQTALPSMRSTLTGWFKPMVVGVVTTSIARSGPNQGESVSVVHEIETSGVLQPDSDGEKLEIRSEGERSWSKWILHVYPQLNVPTDTRIRIGSQWYRVLGKKNYRSNGFIRYNLAEDYDAI